MLFARPEALPELTLRTCERAAADGLPVYLFGSSMEVLRAMSDNLQRQFPALRIAGSTNTPVSIGPRASPRSRRIYARDVPCAVRAPSANKAASSTVLDPTPFWFCTK